MEKVESVEVHQRYNDLRSEGFEPINQVNAMERAFVSRRFSQIGGTRANVEGSLYVHFFDLLPQFHSLYRDSGPDAMPFVRAIINLDIKAS